MGALAPKPVPTAYSDSCQGPGSKKIRQSSVSTGLPYFFLHPLTLDKNSYAVAAGVDTPCRAGCPAGPAPLILENAEVDET